MFGRVKYNYKVYCFEEKLDYLTRLDSSSPPLGQPGPWEVAVMFIGLQYCSRQLKKQKYNTVQEMNTSPPLYLSKFRLKEYTT